MYSKTSFINNVGPLVSAIFAVDLEPLKTGFHKKKKKNGKLLGVDDF